MRVKRILFVLIALLYVASVPWYRELDAPLRIVFGLPDWVAVAIGCYAAAACLNAVAWLLTAQSETPGPSDATADEAAEVGASRATPPELQG